MKCEICEEDYLKDLNEEEIEDEEDCIQENKRCLDCMSEWGDVLWPDQ